MEVLLLRFDSPLMSFGGPAVDQIGVTQEFPARSMLAGLFANALGFDHRDTDKTQELQKRIRFAARRDRRGTLLVDYQTVDLGQDFLSGGGWTTWGRAEKRAGARANSMGTHIRSRHFLADAVYTIAVSLTPEEPQPDLSHLEAALREPARPLYLGRRPCLPAVGLVVGRISASDLKAALAVSPRAQRSDEGDLLAWWPPAGDDDPVAGRDVPVTDDRDWRNQIHVGRRFLREGLLNPPEAKT